MYRRRRSGILNFGTSGLVPIGQIPKLFTGQEGNNSPYLTITVDTTITGKTPSNQFELSLGSYDVNFQVNWGDGTSDVITDNSDAAKLHTYPSPGVYTFEIIGQLDWINYHNNDDAAKLIRVDSWGLWQPKAIERVFARATNLVIQSTRPLDLSALTNFSMTSSFREVSGGELTVIGGPSIVNMNNAFISAGISADLSSLDFSGLTAAANALGSSGFTANDYDKFLLALDRDGVSNISLGASGVNYNISVSGVARQNLIDRGCTIVDAGGI
jgi:hypothetical protein